MNFLVVRLVKNGMRNIYTENSFKRDLRRLQRRGADMKLLHRILLNLQQKVSLPPSARPHLLQGKWYKYRECHITNDWLLVYKITETTLFLIRTGSHTDIFE